MKRNGLIKQDVDFLNNPMWFANAKYENGIFIWQDKDSYVYKGIGSAPDDTDMLVLYYLLMQCQKSKYAKVNIKVNDYEIIKGCGLHKNSYYYAKLRKALDKWNSVCITMEKFEGKKCIKADYFHIVHYVRVDEKYYNIELNKLWVEKIKNSDFYRYVNFDYFVALKSSTSRRLYELLIPFLSSNKPLQISLYNLAKKLCLAPHAIRDEEEIYYDSRILQKIVVAVKRINALSDNKKFSKAVFNVGYNIKEGEEGKVIEFYKKRKHITSKNNKFIEEIRDLLGKYKIEFYEEDNDHLKGTKDNDKYLFSSKYLLDENNECLNWLSTLSEFNTDRIEEIKEMNPYIIGLAYSPTRESYEKEDLYQMGGIYKALKEKWIINQYLTYKKEIKEGKNDPLV